MKDFNKKYDIDSLYSLIKSNNDIDLIIDRFRWLKNNSYTNYYEYIEKIKVLFILSDEYEFLSTAALIFNEFKVHSAVPLIVAKLLSGKYDDSGGTFLYSLLGLRIKRFKEELNLLWQREISWEMQQKLELLNIPQES